MCLIAFAIQASARWPLVIAANRDEYLCRPSAALSRWTSPNGAQVIAGRDLRAGGAWFGITPQGRVAFVTNVREPDAPVAPRSRGELVTRWLESTDDADAFVAGLQPRIAEFAGFNLVVGDAQRRAWHWVTNRSGLAAAHGGLHRQVLAAGVYGLSNAALDTPWPKTLRLKNALISALQTSGQPAQPASLRGALWAALADTRRASAELLPTTGVALAREQALSSAFVTGLDFTSGAYGTVSSTLLTVEASERSGGEPGVEMVSMQERQHQRAADTSDGTAAPVWTLSTEDLAWPVAAAPR